MEGDSASVTVVKKKKRNGRTDRRARQMCRWVCVRGRACVAGGSSSH